MAKKIRLVVLDAYDVEEDSSVCEGSDEMHAFWEGAERLSSGHGGVSPLPHFCGESPAVWFADGLRAVLREVLK